jgi:hypothetical protein
MARSPFSNVLRMPEPEREPLPPPAVIDLMEDGPGSMMEDGALLIETEDGGLIIDLEPKPEPKAKSEDFYANLAEEMEGSELANIADELITGIQSDDQSRGEWLATHAAGIKLLGLTIDENNSSSSTDAPLEGMSTARHPLLLEAVLMFQANARGELLPAAGPAKVRDDRPNKPPAPPMMGHNGGPPLDDMGMAGAGAAPPSTQGLPLNGFGPGVMPPAPPPQEIPPEPSMIPGIPMPGTGPQDEDRDELADALEKDFNHFLTVIAKEYVPDTDRMLFSVGFGGQGIKKVYNCPIRRRPVSESVPMEDFIVSNALTDLSNAQRITHRIKMKPSTMKRMQILGAYRDASLGQPVPDSDVNAIDQAKAEVTGVAPTPNDPKDADYELYEVCCELDLDEYAPDQFKGKGLALPYRVTIEKESRQVLQVVRNWKEDDEQCLPKQYFVEFPYTKAFGFYGIGLLHIVGNLAKALTAMMRISIDNGMFSNFPGFLYAKGAGRQLTNQFQIAPGSGMGLDVGLAKLSDAVMALPYKEFSQAWAMFQQQLAEMGQRVGGTAMLQVGEGKQDAPVGTTLALIEQATKPTGAALKRLHTAQSDELQLIKERFLEDPEAFWRFNRRPTVPWQEDQFIQALNDYDLVPVSDPNNPTKMHRAARAAAVQGYNQQNPGVLDPRKVWERVANAIDEPNPEELLAPPMPPQPPPVDQGKLAMAEAKKMGDQLRAQTELGKAQLGVQEAAASRDARIRELEMKIELEQLKAEAKIEAEQLRISGQLAVAAEKADQADTHKAMEIVSNQEDRAAEREHRERVAEANNKTKIDAIKAKPKPKGGK